MKASINNWVVLHSPARGASEMLQEMISNGRENISRSWERFSQKTSTEVKNCLISLFFPNPMNSRVLPKTTSPIGKPSNTPVVPLPEIPLEMRRITLPLEKNVENMLLDMGFQSLTEQMQNRLIAAGH